jgi:hypothetical protein
MKIYQPKTPQATDGVRYIVVLSRSRPPRWHTWMFYRNSGKIETKTVKAGVPNGLFEQVFPAKNA